MALVRRRVATVRARVVMRAERAFEGDGGLGLEAGCAEGEEEDDGGCEGEDSAVEGHGGIFLGGCGERGR